MQLLEAHGLCKGIRGSVTTAKLLNLMGSVQNYLGMHEFDNDRRSTLLYAFYSILEAVEKKQFKICNEKRHPQVVN